ncbi:MAG: hypothetical protein KUG58_11675 [Marinosulfonomonas sp.]|nr:hypothetical protein [Marinosulfonomonas sp.]
MTFIRAEAKEHIWRFRDALIGGCVSLVGLYMAVQSIGFFSIVGTSLAIAGALLVFAGIQRGRFRAGKDGAGIVHVDEGQVTYFGPLEGGSVVVADLEQVDLDPGTETSPEWVLHDQSARPLRIPTNAEGAETLFDVFASLEGVRLEPMLAKLNNNLNECVVIWQSKTRALH